MLAVVAGLVAARAAAEPGSGTPEDPAREGPHSEVRGVNPADNLTKFELLPKYSRVDADNDVSVSTLTFKYDRAILGQYGVNLELPVADLDSSSGHTRGIGDLNLRGRVQFRQGRATYITGVEAVFPTASDDALGTGKYQLNPTVVGVYAFSEQFFVAGVAKHLFSVAGGAQRDDIVQGQYRFLAARTLGKDWWLLLDPQLWVDYRNSARVQFSCEGEVGRMIGHSTGIWIRGGSRLAGDWHREDWSITAGIRFISF